MALYNNGYPATYQPMYQYQQPYQYAPVQQQNVRPSVQDGRIIVQGIEGAKGYLVAPNNSVDLWDSEEQVIYQKSADASGMPSIKIIDYTYRESSKNSANSVSTISDDKLSNYATKDEIKAISEQIDVLRERLDGLTKRRARLMDDE